MGQATQVLLVDDNPMIRELLIHSLAPLATVHACASAAEALRRAEKQTPDLIVSDFRMPGLSGLELLAKLRISFPRVAVVMLASRADISGTAGWLQPLGGGVHRETILRRRGDDPHQARSCPRHARQGHA